MTTLSEVLSTILTPDDGWSVAFILRVVLSAVLLYAYAVILARLLGSRTFASFTSYDFLTNIAAGSLVASAIMGPSIVEGALGLGALVLLQVLFSGAASRWPAAMRASDNSPVVLVAHGQVQHAAMRRARVAPNLLAQQMRQAGATDLSQVRFAVLESGGTVSIITGEASGVAPDGLPPRGLETA